MRRTSPGFATDIRHNDKTPTTTDDILEDNKAVKKSFTMSCRESPTEGAFQVQVPLTDILSSDKISNRDVCQSSYENMVPSEKRTATMNTLNPMESFKLEDFLKSEGSSLEERLPQLTPPQQNVVDMALAGHNIFLTGAAGSGKTITLKWILRCLEKKFPSTNSQYPRVQVVAPTGIAALPLNGRTMFSFAGWTPNSFQKPMDRLLVDSKGKLTTCETIHHLKVLVIDEISMVESQFLDRFDMLIRHISGVPRPFGGRQVIFVGGFYQLPPVKPFEFCIECGDPMMRQSNNQLFQRNESYVCRSEHCLSQQPQKYFGSGDKWAFKASVWNKLNLRYVKLEQIHRQKSSRFQDILNKVRNGILLSPEEWRCLESKKKPPERVIAIRLMSRVEQVRRFNEKQLASLRTEAHSWTAVDTCRKLGRVTQDPQKQEDYLLSLKKEHKFPTDLALKVGAKVILLVNLDIRSGLVNGSQGEIVGFTKSSRSLAPSRSSKMWQLYRKDHEIANPRRPVVRFEGGRKLVVFAVAQDSLKGTSKDRYLVTRNQIPLTLGWALSIHKARGMTLKHVEVSSRDLFEPAQLYDGLSRAISIEGLTVTGFTRDQLSMDEDVLQFYKETKWEGLKLSEASSSLKASEPDEELSQTQS
ncbi:hypothetical protein B7463_g2640, partial [Scytalidium lignicola]